MSEVKTLSFRRLLHQKTRTIRTIGHRRRTRPRARNRKAQVDDVNYRTSIEDEDENDDENDSHNIASLYNHSGFRRLKSSVICLLTPEH